MKMNIFEENSTSQIISHRKNKEAYDKVIKDLNKKYESSFSFSVEQVRIKLKTVYRNAKG